MWNWLRKLFAPVGREMRICAQCGKTPALADGDRCRECLDEQSFRL